MTRLEGGESGDWGRHNRRQMRGIISRPLQSSAFMGWRIVETTMRVNLRRASAVRAYPFVMGVIALILTVSMAVPFAWILIGAILLRRDRWAEIVLLSSLGSATGGLVLYLIFHHLGWSQIAAAYPDLMQSKAWSDATRWVSAYGTWALFGVAATPFPHTPALIFTAVSRLPLSEVFLALLLGKLLKYGVYGFLAAKFPLWFQHFVPVGCHQQA